MVNKNKNFSEVLIFNATNGYTNYDRPYELDPNYIVGVVFLFTVIGLLLYVNLFYNFSLKAAFIKIYHEPLCSFLKHCVIVQKRPKLVKNNEVPTNVDKKNGIDRKESNCSIDSVFIDYKSTKSNLNSFKC
jgi:hypothetical protein